MKSLLTITALFEASTGIGLIVAPVMLTDILLGASFTEPAAIIVSRIAGASLISVAIACWLSRDIGNHATGIIKALLFYNVAAAIVLIYASLGEHFLGMGLWPAALLHIGLAAWCVVCVRKVNLESTKR